MWQLLSHKYFLQNIPLLVCTSYSCWSLDNRRYIFVITGLGLLCAKIFPTLLACMDTFSLNLSHEKTLSLPLLKFLPSSE